MNKNEFNSWEDIFRFCYDTVNNNSSQKGETKNDNKNDQCNSFKSANNRGEASESARYADSDILGGFQDIPPQLLIVIGNLLGNVIAGNLPFNIQNVVGNWLQLVGQAIEVFNAQQQYYQGGPGRYYNHIYRNVANPFCTREVDETQKNVVYESTTSDSSNINNTSPKCKSANEINELKLCIDNLWTEIDILKQELYEIKKKT